MCEVDYDAELKNSLHSPSGTRWNTQNERREKNTFFSGNKRYPLCVKALLVMCVHKSLWITRIQFISFPSRFLSFSLSSLLLSACFSSSRICIPKKGVQRERVSLKSAPLLPVHASPLIRSAIFPFTPLLMLHSSLGSVAYSLFSTPFFYSASGCKCNRFEDSRYHHESLDWTRSTIRTLHMSSIWCM